MKTNPVRAAMIASFAAASVAVELLILSGCSSDPAAKSPEPTPEQRRAQMDRRADARHANARSILSVAYPSRLSGAVVVVSSSPPTVETLPSGLYRVTFPSGASHESPSQPIAARTP